MSNDVEIEIKIKINEEKFNELKKFFNSNATFVKEVEQKDEYFTSKFEDFTKEKYPYKWLSIRERGEKKILNYKHFYPEKEEIHLYCDEYEVNIDDIDRMKNIFNELNIISFALIHKNRNIYMYKNDKYEIALDKVENLGYFIEIEVKKIELDIEEERKLLDDEAKKLNLNLDDVDQRGYPFYFIRNQDWFFMKYFSINFLAGKEIKLM